MGYINDVTNKVAHPLEFGTIFADRDMIDVFLQKTGLTAFELQSWNYSDKLYRLRSAISEGTLEYTDFLPDAVEDAADPDGEVEPFGTVWLNTTSGAVFQSDGRGNWKELSSGE